MRSKSRLGTNPGFPPLEAPSVQCRCGCVEQMERFVGFDDNAANGTLERSWWWENSPHCLVWFPLPPFKYYRHEHSISVKRELNWVVQMVKRSHWQEVWKSDSKGCEACSNPILLVCPTVSSPQILHAWRTANETRLTRTLKSSWGRAPRPSGSFVLKVHSSCTVQLISSYDAVCVCVS